MDGQVDLHPVTVETHTHTHFVGNLMSYYTQHSPQGSVVVHAASRTWETSVYSNLSSGLNLGSYSCFIISHAIWSFEHTTYVSRFETQTTQRARRVHIISAERIHLNDSRSASVMSKLKRSIELLMNMDVPMPQLVSCRVYRVAHGLISWEIFILAWCAIVDLMPIYHSLFWIVVLFLPLVILILYF